VTADKLDRCWQVIRNLLPVTSFAAIDCETDVPEESKPWLAKIYEELGKARAPIQVDVVESKLVGMSMTLGNNLQHTFYFPIDHADTNNITTEQARDVMLSVNIPKIAHSASGFEIPVFFLNWGGSYH